MVYATDVVARWSDVRAQDGLLAIVGSWSCRYFYPRVSLGAATTRLINSKM